MSENDNISFRGYDMFNKTSASLVDDRPIGGSSILIKKGIPHEALALHTNLQAVAAKITLHCTFTICSIYIPPRYELTQAELDRLVSQLPQQWWVSGRATRTETGGLEILPGSGRVRVER